MITGSLNERPWRLKGVSVIQIDSTITSIGSYAFANMDKVNRIIMGTSTFIEDTTIFQDCLQTNLPYLRYWCNNTDDWQHPLYQP